MQIIPNQIVLILFIYGVLISIIEGFFYIDILLFFIFSKIFLFFGLFLLSLLLFKKKLIGGGDGKILISFFLALPFKYLPLFIVLFFPFYIFFIVFTLNMYYLLNRFRLFIDFDLLSQSFLFQDSPSIKQDSIALLIPHYLSYLSIIFLIYL